MCRIVVNPVDLAETASLLADAAGEYQAIGTHVAGCNCSCMPADVAAVVDAVTADVRSGLTGIAGGLFHQSADLTWRAEIDQAGAFTGDSQIVTIGGFSSPWLTGGIPATPITVTIGGGFNTPVSAGGGISGQTVTIGGDFHAPVHVGGSYSGQSVTIGADFHGAGLGSGGGAGQIITIGSGFDNQVINTGSNGTQTVTIGGDFYSPITVDHNRFDGQVLTLGGVPWTSTSAVIEANRDQYFSEVFSTLATRAQMPIGYRLPNVNWAGLIPSNPHIHPIP